MKMFVDVHTVYLHTEAVDFRKAINGLVLVVQQQMALSPFADALFVFCNKNRDKIKALYWDKTGFALWQKRLEKQKFKWPKTEEELMNIDATQWQRLLSGFDIVGHQSLFYNGVGESE